VLLFMPLWLTRDGALLAARPRNNQWRLFRVFTPIQQNHQNHHSDSACQRKKDRSLHGQPPLLLYGSDP